MSTLRLSFFEGRKGVIARLPSGKVVLPARGFSPRAGERWECRVEERERYALAHPLHKLVPRTFITRTRYLCGCVEERAERDDSILVPEGTAPQVSEAEVGWTCPAHEGTIVYSCGHTARSPYVLGEEHNEGLCPECTSKRLDELFSRIMEVKEGMTDRHALSREEVRVVETTDRQWSSRTTCDVVVEVRLPTSTRERYAPDATDEEGMLKHVLTLPELDVFQLMERAEEEPEAAERLLQAYEAAAAQGWRRVVLEYPTITETPLPEGGVLREIIGGYGLDKGRWEYYVPPAQKEVK